MADHGLTEIDDFYHSPGGAHSDVSGVKNTFAVGNTLTMFGRGTNVQDSGTVGWTNVTNSGFGHLVCLNQDIMGYGDSGGPVYVRSTAAGFISGSFPVGGGWRLCLSQARYIDDALGVSIKQ